MAVVVTVKCSCSGCSGNSQVRRMPWRRNQWVGRGHGRRHIGQVLGETFDDVDAMIEDDDGMMTALD
eukprot:2984140-Pyramimonas_sp.AAC.1